MIKKFQTNESTDSNSSSPPHDEQVRHSRISLRHIFGTCTFKETGLNKTVYPLSKHFILKCHFSLDGYIAPLRAVTFQFVVITTALLVLSLAVLGCEHQATTEAAAEAGEMEGLPEQESWNVSFGVFNDDAPRLKIEAPYMAKFANDSTYTIFRTDPEGEREGRVRAHIFSEEGDSTAVMQSDRLIQYEDENFFEARGNVLVETVDDKRIEGEHLTWYEEEGEIRTPEFVRIITPTERLQGYGLTADERFDNYELTNVTGEAEIEDL